MNIIAWATRHHISLTAVQELLHEMGEGFDSPQPAHVDGHSEAAVSSRVLLESASKGVLLFRNNVGAYHDESGRLVRYGLCNETKAMNASVKSHDFIGIRRVHIMPCHLGHVIGQFVSREIKASGWTYNMRDAHQVAQAKFGSIITSYGGDAAFATGVGSL